MDILGVVLVGTGKPAVLPAHEQGNIHLHAAPLRFVEPHPGDLVAVFAEDVISDDFAQLIGGRDVEQKGAALFQHAADMAEQRGDLCGRDVVEAVVHAQHEVRLSARQARRARVRQPVAQVRDAAGKLFGAGEHGGADVKAGHVAAQPREGAGEGAAAAAELCTPAALDAEAAQPPI